MPSNSQQCSKSSLFTAVFRAAGSAGQQLRCRYSAQELDQKDDSAVQLRCVTGQPDEGQDRVDSCLAQLQPSHTAGDGRVSKERHTQEVMAKSARSGTHTDNGWRQAVENGDCCRVDPSLMRVIVCCMHAS